jgi:hypothetical protein
MRTHRAIAAEGRASVGPLRGAITPGGVTEEPPRAFCSAILGALAAVTHPARSSCFQRSGGTLFLSMCSVSPDSMSQRVHDELGRYAQLAVVGDPVRSKDIDRYSISAESVSEAGGSHAIKREI